MQVEETVYYLQMRDSGDLRPARRAREDLTVYRVEPPCGRLSRSLYMAVGGDWLWTDRLDWSDPQWHGWVGQPGYELWRASVGDAAAGYFELTGPCDGDVELAFFGLLPAFIGRGLGGELLTRAILKAWDKGTRRVLVHTSSLDHPAALKNYQARGFQLVRSETMLVEKPGVGESVSR